jgi:hypothetical protein
MNSNNNNRKITRIFGAVFILTFLSYGIGSSLIASVINAPDFLSNIYTNQDQIIIGVMLMALVHTCTNISLPLLMFPILKPHSQYLAYGYLSFAIAATVILVVGALFLLLLLPLSEAYAKSGFIMTSNFEIMGALFKKAEFYSYHMEMALWSIGGLMFVSALYKSKLIPRAMSVWGIVGYITLISGSVMEICKHHDMVEIISIIPGGLFEITLSIWFIFKDINSTSLEAIPMKPNSSIEAKY